MGPVSADIALDSGAAAAITTRLSYTLMVAGAAALGGLMFGFDIAIITGAGPFIERQFVLSPIALGWAFSSLLFGCIIGAAASGMLVARLGRRPTMVLVAAGFAATTVATGLAPDFTFFIVARFLGGLAVGAVSLVAPMYVAEVTPPAYRGRMGALYQMAIVTGILASYLVNYLLKDLGNDAWRYMFYTGALPAAIYLSLALTVPESPRFLVKSGKDGEALRVLARIGGVEPAAAVADIRASLDRPSPGWGELLAGSARRPLAISIVLAILVHLTGINTIIEYAPSIFRSAGFDLDAALLSTFVVGIANFAFTLLSFWMIDRFGRRPLYIAGSGGMALILAIAAVSVATGHFRGLAALGMIVAFLLFFASCIGPVFWTLLPEIFPNAARGKALSVPVLTQWGANAVVVLVFPAFLSALGPAATFAFFAVACLVQAVFAYIAVPETKNRSLEDIDSHWARRAERAGT